MTVRAYSVAAAGFGFLACAALWVLVRVVLVAPSVVAVAYAAGPVVVCGFMCWVALRCRRELRRDCHGEVSSG